MLAQIEKANKKKQGVKVKFTGVEMDLYLSLIVLPKNGTYIYKLVSQWIAEGEEKFKAKVVEAYEREGSAYYSTARLWDDGIIDPADTRKVIGFCISASMNRPTDDTRYGVFRM